MSKSRQSKSQRRQQKVKDKSVRKEKLRPNSWLPFQEVDVNTIVNSKPAEIQDHVRLALQDTRFFVNNFYQVSVKQVATGTGLMYQLAIQRNDGQAVHDWREFQKIKNLLVGAEAEAVELYPAESRLLDVSNVYYLYTPVPVRNENNEITFLKFQFGFPHRMVSEVAPHGLQQRPWSKEDRPADLTVLTREKVQEAYEVAKQHAREAVQEAFSEVNALQEAPDIETAVREALGASYDALAARVSFARLTGLVNDLVEALRRRRTLMHAEGSLAPGESNEGEIHSLGLEALGILTTFREAQQESDRERDAATNSGQGPAGGTEDRPAAGNAEEPPAGRGDGADALRAHPADDPGPGDPVAGHQPPVRDDEPAGPTGG